MKNSEDLGGCYKGVLPFHFVFFCSPKLTQPRPQVNSSITCSGLHFWCLFDIIDFNMTKLLTSSVQYDKVLSKFGQQELGMVNYACDSNQLVMGNILNE